MGRLTFDGLFCDIAMCKETPGGTFCENGSCSQRKVWERLKEYEDTGVEPDMIEAVINGQITLQKALEKYTQAEEQGRLVVLEQPMRPLIWGDDDHDSILCPNCERDLMGGFEVAGPGEEPMHQCPYCGQPIDSTKALTREEAERALEGQKDG